MAKLFFCILVFSAVIGGIFLFFRKPQTKKMSQKEHTEKKVVVTPPVIAQSIKSKSVFVPSWAEVSEGEQFDGYDRVIYFGVSLTRNGVDKTSAEYTSLAKIVSIIPTDKKVWITTKMLDTDTNAAILNNPAGWDNIATDMIDIVKGNGAKGIVLDLEMSALPTDALAKRITEYVTHVHQKLSEREIPLALAIYGDTFFRKRPFDIKALGENSDEIMIMAYDFHKSYGEPGPNFPLRGRDTYGYDFETLVTDYASQVKPEKLTVIFGMYGYDWIVDEKKRPIKPAKALPLGTIRTELIQSCTKKNCVTRRDDQSAETEINYIDEYVNYHIVWFEDDTSVSKKIDFMKQKGIVNTAYWAYGYY